MTEAFLHYIWKMKLFSAVDLHTTDGDALIIISGGEQNMHAGPDFTNAKIKIGNTIWAGNVEIHVRSSDWKLHKHQLDDAYKNVILHVVYENEEIQPDIPTLELKSRIQESLYTRYNAMLLSTSWIPCDKHIKMVPAITVHTQLARMLADRLAEKAVRLEQRLLLNKNDWEETSYQLLARSFGTNVNADPFERLAQSLPFNLLRKHLNNPLQVEALLFGQAGFLQSSFKELYPHQLQSEYKHLQKKYSLIPVQKMEWKFLRLRPANFPTIRLSQFASFLTKHDRIFQGILDAATYKNLQVFFASEASAYWKEHYSFKKASQVRHASTGKTMINLIMINTIAPLMYLYGHKTGSQQYITRAIDLLEEIPPEKNHILASWNNLGLHASSAADSQALLYLKKEYCTNKKCLDCAIGNTILKDNFS
jgi:hypothetical protein